MQLYYSTVLYLQWVFGADGQDLVLEVAELTAPGPSFTDPADKAGLVGAAHRAITATGAQQLSLQDTKGSCMSSNRGPAWCCDCVPVTRSVLSEDESKNGDQERPSIWVIISPSLKSHFIYSTVWGYRVCSYLYREAASTVAERAQYAATY